ncbi:MAG: N-acetylmuramoyl-L-alanine amidase [Clostridia bacterium]|nr:N-acetylmuramoyl-L-alanine amidase [Clostridia bacterium]
MSLVKKSLSIIIALLIAISVVSIGVYAETPDLIITNPAKSSVIVTQSEFLIRGKCLPNTDVHISGKELSENITCDEEGNFSFNANSLRLGVNKFIFTFEEDYSVVSIDYDPDYRNLSVTSPESNSFETTASSYTFKGTCRNNSTVLINEKKVVCDSMGNFSYKYSLSYGENKIKVQYNEQAFSYTINRRYVVIKSYTHKSGKTYKSGATFTVKVNAKAKANVTATLNGKTITLNAGTAKDGFADYTGKFTLTNKNLYKQNYGAITYKATYSKYSESFTTKPIFVNRNESLIKNYNVATIDLFEAETFNGNTTNDLSRPTNSYLINGSTDYCKKKYQETKDNTFVEWAYGKRTYYRKPKKPSKTKELVVVTKKTTGKLPDHNDISVASTKISNNHTIMTFNSDFKAPHSIYLGPQSYVNASAQDYRITSATYTYVDITFHNSSTFTGSANINLKNNPLFKSYKVTRKTTGYILRLYLKNKGYFYGFNAAYNSKGQLVIEFLNPQKAKSVNQNTSSKNAKEYYGADLSGIKVFIDVGHGGIDSGAVGSGYYEKKANLNLANKLKKELTSLGATVVMSRTSDATVTYDDRCIALQKAKADLCISIHHDSNNSKSLRGCGVFYFDAFSKNAANKIYSNVKSSKQYTKTNLKWHYFFLARETCCPVVLTENGYMSNASDLKIIKNDSQNTKKAKTLTKGIVSYFKSVK